MDEYDEFVNKKTAQKFVGDIDTKKALKTNNSKFSYTAITDANVNKIQKPVLVEDQCNTISENDINQMEFDEFGNKYEK